MPKIHYKIRESFTKSAGIWMDATQTYMVLHDFLSPLEPTISSGKSEAMDDLFENNFHDDGSIRADQAVVSSYSEPWSSSLSN